MIYATYATGSRLWFSCYSDFKPKDVDQIVVLDHLPEKMLHVAGEVDMFMYERMSKDEFMQLISKRPNAIIALLNPEFAKSLRVTIDDLISLKHEMRRCMILSGRRCRYLKIIYDSYVANHAFMLTAEQRLQAYESYKASRPSRYP